MVNSFPQVDRFLAELGRRLDFMDSYGHLSFEAHRDRAYSTLHAVRESCARVSDGVWDAGRRRANIIVETLEERYNEAIAKRETLEQKVQEGVKLMEDILADFESRAYAMRDQHLSYIDESWRRMDERMGKAREALGEGMDKARRAKEQMVGSVEYAIEQAKKLAKERGMINYNEIPIPWRTNPHIIRGYRFHVTKLECLRSVFGVHNEMTNIWTHAIGLIIVLAVAFYFYPTSANFSISTRSDVFIAAVFFFAACKCLVCSVMWHTFNSISEQTLMERFACVDYTGISMLVGASIMTTEYCAFYCEPVSRWIYLCTTAVLSIAGAILPWNPTFNRADMSLARVGFYITLSLTGALPIAQLVYTRGVAWAWHFYSPLTTSVMVYIVGACVYAAKIPERWCPGGITDFVGSSHNLWHLAVIGGILFHFVAMQRFFSEAFLRASVECSVY